MADITVRRNHGMEFDEAKTKVHDIVSDLEQDLDVVKKVKWNAQRTAADVSGTGFKGKFEVDPKEVVVEIDLGLLGKPFKGKIEEKIKKKMDSYFG